MGLKGLKGLMKQIEKLEVKLEQNDIVVIKPMYLSKFPDVEQYSFFILRL